MSEFRIRTAQPSDCADLAILENMASRGLALWFWQGAVMMGKASDAYEWGRRRMLNPDTPTGWHNSSVAEKDSVVMGATASYELIPDKQGDVPPQMEPLLELHRLAANNWYLDSIAVYSDYQQMGVGDALMTASKEAGHAKGFDQMALIAEDVNEGALRLYARHGFSEQARRPFVEFNGKSDTKHWLLLSASLN